MERGFKDGGQVIIILFQFKAGFPQREFFLVMQSKNKIQERIDWLKSWPIRQPITWLNSCFRMASRKQIHLVENGLNIQSLS